MPKAKGTVRARKPKKEVKKLYLYKWTFTDGIFVEPMDPTCHREWIQRIATVVIFAKSRQDADRLIHGNAKGLVLEQLSKILLGEKIVEADTSEDQFDFERAKTAFHHLEIEEWPITETTFLVLVSRFPELMVRNTAKTQSFERIGYDIPKDTYPEINLLTGKKLADL